MDINHYSHISSHFAELASVLMVIDRVQIDKAIKEIRAARATSNNVWIVGNGGSAAAASHFANDLTKMSDVKAIAVPDLVPIVTAYGNDEGWDRMYADTIHQLSNPGDVIVAISCSGNSINVVKAVEELNKTIVLTGNDPDCELSKGYPDVFIMVPSDDITIQEDAHLAICHAIAKALK